ncbi:hypothetical protein MCERE1_00048 [Burkholderiaceae bacterium]
MKARSNLMDMASTAGMSPEVPVTQPRANPAPSLWLPAASAPFQRHGSLNSLPHDNTSSSLIHEKTPPPL